MTLGMYTFLILTFIAANLPFITKNLFFVIGFQNKKHFLLELLECIVYYGLMTVVAYFMESKLNGSVHKQGLVFYIITFSLFLVFAFPGFVLSHFWHAKHFR